ncbi:MAG TPA: hypothetical protein VGE21_11080 [Flavobacteriales bacterium]
MKHLWGVVVAGLMLAACGDGKKEAAERLAQEADSLAQLSTAIDLEPHGFPLELQAPDAQTLMGAEPAVVFNENTGKLEIRAGDRFALTVVEEPGDMARLKADLDREQVRRNTVTSETPELLIYQSEFPDDPSLVFLHFYRIVQAGGRTFVVEDLQEGKPFNAQDIERMTPAVRAKQPV